MPILRRVLPLAAALLAAAPLSAQAIRGRVLDAASGEPVALVAVQALSLEGRDMGRARTGADGTFNIQLRAPGTAHIQAARAGYRTTVTSDLPVNLRETVEVEVRIAASAVAMEPLRVTARVEPPHHRKLELNGFYDRERTGIGRYVRREDFENRSTTTMQQLLARVPGAQTLYAGTKQYIFFPRNGAATPSCLPRLWLDGVRVTYDAQNDINSVVSPNQVEAVEVFRGPSEIPVQYNDNNSMCGVIVIWTRAGT